MLLLLLCCFGLWFVGGTWKVAHSPLEFFNELAGGSKGGYQYLVDSNIDWGQNLWTLRQWIEQSDVDQVKYAHYSPASPEQYDIQSVFLPPDPRAITFTPWHPESGTYVIGATILQGAYTSDPNTYAYFRAREPDARIGGALFIYNIDQRLKPSCVVSCDLEPTPDTIRRQLSDHTVRVIQIDCQQTQVFPTSEGTGFVITSPKGNVPISGSRYFTLKSNDNSIESP